MYEIGAPAEWANEQKWKRRKTSATEAIRGTVVSLLAVGAAVLLLLNRPADNPQVGNVMLVVAFAIVISAAVFTYRAFTKAKSTWKRASQAKIGVQSERDVQKALRSKPRQAPKVAVYGLQLNKRSGDLDLTLVNRHLALAAVEIKTGFGKVSVQGNQIRAGRRVIPGDPMGQVRRQSVRLSEKLGGVEIVDVVCIPGMTNRAFVSHEHNTLICNATDLAAAVDEVAHARAFNSEQEAARSLESIGV